MTPRETRMVLQKRQIVRAADRIDQAYQILGKRGKPITASNVRRLVRQIVERERAEFRGAL